MAEEKKTCNRCHKTKALDEFHRSADSDDGHKPYCKDCCRAYQTSRKDPKADMGPMYKWCPGCKTHKHKGRSFTVCRHEDGGNRPVYYKRCDVCLGYEFSEDSEDDDPGVVERPKKGSKKKPKTAKNEPKQPKQLDLFETRPVETKLSNRAMREIIRECIRIGSVNVVSDIQFMIDKRIGEMYPKED